jgi:hypothetical protein
MKKYTLFFISMLMFNLSALAQEKLYVYSKDGSVAEFVTSNVEEIGFEETVVPYIPTDSGFVFKKFSINPVEKVYFSPGNLQYHPHNGEWRFAPNQINHVGKANANIHPNYNGWIDLFGWGTGDNPTKSSINWEDYQFFTDWGANEISGYPANTWRSLSYNEWNYLLYERENASNLIAVARVDGNNCVILLPDDWKCPTGVELKLGFGVSDDAYASVQIIDAADWAKIESTGAVLFLACGYRSGTTINDLQENCRYWIGYWHMDFTASMFYGTAARASLEFTYPYDGLAVRLVSTETY